MECCECYTTSVTEIILLTATKTLIVCSTVRETFMLNAAPSTRFLWGRPTMTIREKETSREGERNLVLDLDREGRLSDLSRGGREVQKVEHINSVKCSSSSFWFVVLTAQLKSISKCYLEHMVKINQWSLEPSFTECNHKKIAVNFHDHRAEKMKFWPFRRSILRW